MEDSSRKALGEMRQKDSRSGEGKNALKELFISLLFFLRAAGWGQELRIARLGRL